MGQVTQSRLKLEDLDMARRKAVDVAEEAKTDAVVEEATNQVTDSTESAPAEVEKAEEIVAEEPTKEEVAEEPAKEEVVEEPAKEEPAKEEKVAEEPAKKEAVVKITSTAKSKTAPEPAKEKKVTDKTSASEFVKNVTIYYTPTGNKVLFSKYSGVVKNLEKCENYIKVSVFNKSTSSFVDGYIHI